MTTVEQQAELKEYRLYIAGEEVAATGGRTFKTCSPLTGGAWAQIADSSPEDVDRAVTAAHAAFRSPQWRSLSPTRRGRLMMRLADLIAENAEAIATVETRDNGKLYKEMLAQLRVVPEWLYYFGGLADKIEGRTIPLDRTSVLQLHAPGAARRHRRDHAVELADSAHDDGRGAGPGSRQRSCHQAFGVHFCLDLSR